MCHNHTVLQHSGAPRNSEPDPADPAETQHAVRNRHWVPHAGGQDDGSLHKLPQIKKQARNALCLLLDMTFRSSSGEFRLILV